MESNVKGQMSNVNYLMEFKYKDTALVSDKNLQRIAAKVKPYISRLQTVAKKGGYEFPEGAINLPFDKELPGALLETVKQKISKNLRYIVVVGIGGSNLGTKAVYDASSGWVDVLEPERYPKIIFADTCDPEFLIYLSGLLETRLNDPQEILVNIISKSGNTTETIVNGEIIMDILLRRWGDRGLERLVVTTDKGSELWQAAEARLISRLEVPINVGGRFSVFSAVGLFPLLSTGLNVSRLLDGARDINKSCLDLEIENNPAALSALILFWHQERGLPIHDTFIFHPELESLGKWYRQLLAESSGKEKKQGEEMVAIGILPTVSIGSTDLHSMAQLYLGGPKRTVTTFVTANREKGLPLKSPKQQLFPGLVDGIKGTAVVKVMDAIFEGTRTAYLKKGLPFMEVVLSGISAYALGEFLQFKMLEVMYLSELLGVDPFNQPHVELYKQETRRILTGRKK